MRRSDREVCGTAEIADILSRCDSLALAMNDDGYPYVIPMSFGFKTEGERFTLFLHCATEGKKLELIRKDNRVAFEADCSHRLIINREGGHCTTEYESAAGTGRAYFAQGSLKEEGLNILMRHYAGTDFVFNTAAVPRTEVICIDVETITGKRRIKK